MAHWYCRKTGGSAYEIVGANGKLRDTTLRDARVHGYLPSVTTITGVADAPGLVVYKQQQLLEAVLKYPYSGPPVNVDMWKKAVLKESGEHAKKASERGNELHNALEDYYSKGKIAKAHAEYIEPVIEFIEKRFPGVKWIAEASFANTEHGFGGKVDMHSPEGIVLDFKTKVTDDLKKMKAYDPHHMQTAAYAVGLEMKQAERYNLFISTARPNLLNLTESTDFDREWGMFESLLNYWRLCSKYDPRQEVIKKGELV